MFLATINKPRSLIYLCYIGHVTAKDLQQGLTNMEALLADIPAGFRLIADLSRVETMDMDCVAEIGKAMELFERHKLGLVVRVVPDPGKDIGFNIISAFHYKNRPRTATCDTMEQAAKLLRSNPPGAE